MSGFSRTNAIEANLGRVLLDPPFFRYVVSGFSGPAEADVALWDFTEYCRELQLHSAMIARKLRGLTRVAPDGRIAAPHMMRSAERKLQMVAINYDDLSLAFDFVSSGPPGQDLLELRSVLERLQTSREWR